MPVLIDRSGEWTHELRTLKRRCGVLQQSLFASCCQLQRDPKSVDCNELFRQAYALRAVKQRVSELERVAKWVSGTNSLNSE
jgi:hypothetical protein